MISLKFVFLQKQRQKILQQKENQEWFKLMKIKYVSFLNLEKCSNSFSRKIFYAFLIIILTSVLFIHSFYTFILGCVWYIWSKACTKWSEPVSCYGGKRWETLSNDYLDDISECESLCIEHARSVGDGCCQVYPHLPLGLGCYWKSGAKGVEDTLGGGLASICTNSSEFYFILCIQLKGFIILKSQINIQ